MGLWSKGKTPDLHSGNEGSTPSDSTDEISVLGPSFNGRTMVSQSVDEGSIPSGSTAFGM